ncbi:MAG: chemotaxis protein CheW [Gammaproteobacteria bacterium]|nr:chemotaxis protein CheW [Gammaproteobacteria bacterium]
MQAKQISVDQVLTFKINDSLFCIPVDIVESVIEMPEITTLPHAPEYIAGSFLHRRQVIVAVKLRHLLKMDTGSDARRPSMVVVNLDGNPLGLWIDEIKGLVDTDRCIQSELPTLALNQGLRQALIYNDQVIYPVNINAMSRLRKELDQLEARVRAEAEAKAAQEITPTETVAEVQPESIEAAISPEEIAQDDLEADALLEQAETVAEALPESIDDEIAAEEIAQDDLETTALLEEAEAVEDVLPVSIDDEIAAEEIEEDDLEAAALLEEAEAVEDVLPESIDDEIAAEEIEEDDLEAAALLEEAEAVEDVLPESINDEIIPDEIAQDDLEAAALLEEAEVVAEVLPENFNDEITAEEIAEDDLETTASTAVENENEEVTAWWENIYQAGAESAHEQAASIQFDPQPVSQSEIIEELLTEDEVSPPLTTELSIAEHVAPEPELEVIEPEAESLALIEEVELDTAIDIEPVILSDAAVNDELSATPDNTVPAEETAGADPWAEIDTSGESIELDLASLQTEDAALIDDEEDEWSQVDDSSEEVTLDLAVDETTDDPAAEDITQSLTVSAADEQTTDLVSIPVAGDVPDAYASQTAFEASVYPVDDYAEETDVAQKYPEEAAQDSGEANSATTPHEGDFIPADKPPVLVKNKKNNIFSKTPPHLLSPKDQKVADVVQFKAKQPEIVRETDTDKPIPYVDIRSIVSHAPGENSSNFLRNLLIVVLAVVMGGVIYWRQVDWSVKQKFVKQLPPEVQTKMTDLMSYEMKISKPTEGPDRLVVELKDHEIRVIHGNKVDPILLKQRQEQKAKIYKVKKGDTLWSIAERYLENPYSYPELARNNDIKKPNLIYPGDIVTIQRKIPE